MPDATVTRWTDPQPPDRETLEAIFHAERLSPAWWSNGPGDRYAAHSHGYHKVLYCARGSIRFTLESTGETIDLSPGDRLDLPPGTPTPPSSAPKASPAPRLPAPDQPLSS